MLNKLSVLQRCSMRKGGIMPWYNGDYPPSYKNQPAKIRKKATEITNALLEEGTEEGIAIATGLKKAREHFKNEEGTDKKKKSE